MKSDVHGDDGTAPTYLGHLLGETAASDDGGNVLANQSNITGGNYGSELATDIDAEHGALGVSTLTMTVF